MLESNARRAVFAVERFLLQMWPWQGCLFWLIPLGPRTVAKSSQNETRRVVVYIQTRFVNECYTVFTQIHPWDSGT